MTVLDRDIEAFEHMRPELEAHHLRQWVVFRAGEYIDLYPSFDAAASAAADRFDQGPYLIRQIGAPSQVQLTGGMIFTPSHAVSLSGV